MNLRIFENQNVENIKRSRVDNNVEDVEKDNNAKGRDIEDNDVIETMQEDIVYAKKTNIEDVKQNNDVEMKNIVFKNKKFEANDVIEDL